MLHIFSDKEFNRRLATLVLPITLQQLMLAVVSASDAIMLNFISQDKMSAVSLATQITFVENLFLAAMTIGLSMLAAQYWGKKDLGAVERIFAYVMKITVIISFLFAAAAFFCPVILMSLLTNEPLLIEGGAEYLRIVAPSYLLTGISQIYLCILKNSGRAKTAGLISSACMAGNILMNLILILGLLGFPRLEITGAAISTDLARAAEVLWCTAILSKQDSVRLRVKNILHTDKMLSRDFWKYTTPVLGNEIVWGVGFTMYSVIMGHLGSDAVAANSIANIVKKSGLLSMPRHRQRRRYPDRQRARRRKPSKRKGIWRPALYPIGSRRDFIRSSVACFQSSGIVDDRLKRHGIRIPEMDACHLLLLYDWEIGQQHDRGRNFLRRRRQQVRFSL